MIHAFWKSWHLHSSKHISSPDIMIPCRQACLIERIHHWEYKLSLSWHLVYNLAAGFSTAPYSTQKVDGVFCLRDNLTDKLMYFITRILTFCRVVFTASGEEAAMIPQHFICTAFNSAVWWTRQWVDSEQQCRTAQRSTECHKRKRPTRTSSKWRIYLWL